MTITTHGHHIPGTPVQIGSIPLVIRCGGIESCLRCSQEAELVQKIARTSAWGAEPAHIKPNQEYHDDQTLLKVGRALRSVNLSEGEVMNAIRAMQDAGILFRERIRQR